MKGWLFVTCTTVPNNFESGLKGTDQIVGIVSSNFEGIFSMLLCIISMYISDVTFVRSGTLGVYLDDVTVISTIIKIGNVIHTCYGFMIQ